MPKRFFLIDGHSHCYRAFYALPPLSAPDGRPTNAVLGFTNILFKILREQKPEYVAVAFDSGLTFRHEQFVEYKANRKAMPDELRTQIEIIKEMVSACNIPVLIKQGFEADDIIGTMALKAAEKEIDVYIVTSDKDTLQLLSDHIRRFDAANGNEYTVDDLKKEKSIAPEQVTDMMALSGDTSDNIPGVEGIGEKTALQLIHEYGTLDNVLANIDSISGAKRKERLARDAEKARLSKSLATIDTNVELEFDVEDCKRQDCNAERLLEIFRDLDFKKYVSDFSAELVAAPKPRDYHLVGTPQELEQFLNELRTVPEFAVDTETTDQRPLQAKLVGMSFSWKDDEAWYLPFYGPLGEILQTQDVLDALKPILEDESIGKIGQNLKYDLLVLRNAGVNLKGITFDTMIASYLLDPGRRRNNLADLCFDYLVEQKIRIEDLIGKGKKQLTINMVDVAAVCEYACEDADVTRRLAAVLRPKLEEQGLDRLLREVELPLMYVLADMEYNGVRIDVPFLKAMSEKFDKQIAELEKEIQRLAGFEFNVASPKQLSEVLFDKLGLKKSKKTTLGWSTNAGVLEELSNHDDDLPAKVLEYRQLTKLKSTYIDSLPKMINRKTGRIHTSFNQTITATGRLSSSEPNLQNIPIRTEIGRAIRKAFLPASTDAVILAADYSQVELRILAHLSEDPALTAAFREDKDIHAFVASQVFGVELDGVTSDMRRKAKAVNFGIIYGLTPYGLSKGIKISVDEAKKFIDAYFERYGRVREYIDTIIAGARERRYVVTILNRRRNIPTITSTNEQERRFAERIAINTVIQGSAADLIKVAMNNIHAKLVSGGHAAKLILQIHDELVYEIPNAELLFARQLIEREMTGAFKLRIPLQVNIEVGPNWLETA